MLKGQVQKAEVEKESEREASPLPKGTSMRLQTLIQALPNATEIVIIGGTVVEQYVPSYQTNDFDVCYNDTPANWQRIIQWLDAFRPVELRAGPGLTVPFPWDHHTPMADYTLATAVGDVDLLRTVQGVGGFQQALTHSIQATLFGRQIPMLDLPALIASKRSAGRQKDLAVLPDLERINQQRQP